MPDNARFIGLMSGTSLDGVDGVIVDESCKKILQAHYTPYPAQLKSQLKMLISQDNISLKKLAKLDIMVADILADTVNNLLQKANLIPKDIVAIGSHGQSIYHQGGVYSHQIGHGALISANTQITCISDFRMADIAVGGQGAPLTPKYHQHLLNGKNGVVLNLGGIANITIMQNNQIFGFDTGPANTLLDGWIKAQKNLDYDKDGLWARTGKVDAVLLKALLADDFFQKATPKSTGPEYFNQTWLVKHLNKQSSEDVMRTLVAFSAASISQHIPNNTSVYLCGGGVHNLLLRESLTFCNPHCEFDTTMALGIHPDFVEAAAFAFFAQQKLNHQPSSMPEVTGGRSEQILGTIWQI
jgi:anhydro-N-acetylmuramic acid kinase